MDRVLNALKREPVRVRLYGLAVLVAGYLVARGVIQPTDYTFIVGVAALVLGVETARAAVTPVKGYSPKHKA